jgi:hypothetical protein
MMLQLGMRRLPTFKKGSKTLQAIIKELKMPNPFL